MSEERLKILEMLEKGLISTNEAAELLSAIDNPKVGDKNSRSVDFGKKAKEKFLKIHVLADDAKVNINIPLTFIKAAIANGNVESLLNKSISGVDEEVKDSIDIGLIIACIEQEIDGEIVNIETDDAKVSIRIE